MGDPVGVGPELLLRGFSHHPRRLHVGDPHLFKLTADHFRLSLEMCTVSSPEEATKLPKNIFAIMAPQESTEETIDTLPFGHFEPRFATVTVASIRTCCLLAHQGRVEAMVTPPINKGVLHAAGFTFPGHTELIGDFAQVQNPVMMLTGQGLRVVPLTIHQSLASVNSSITQEKLEQTIRTTWDALIRDFGIPSPRITVAGLNPHAGEHGSFGREEIDVIQPVCDRLRMNLSSALQGPLPADTLFHVEARSRYDAVILMYHDQALIPLKMLAFGEAVNVTLGLPFIRTSVDHGTAYDIAGRGVADLRSYQEALNLAGVLAGNRRQAS